MVGKKRTHEEFVELINDINPDIEIIGKYVNAKTKIECKCKKCGHKWSPLANSVVQGFGCPNCQLISMKFSHEEFVDKMKNKQPNIEVIGKYISMSKRIAVKCKIHNFEWHPIAQTVLETGRGCKFCSSKILKRSFIQSQEDFKNYIQTVNQNIEIIGDYINCHTKILCKCKLCNSELYINPDNVFTYKRINCPVCSDGISYPNKYIRNFLKQLPIENLEYEWKLKDYKQYSYDNYFIYNNTEYIVEADGAQHYKKNKFGKWKPDEVQERDKIKNELATNHNIKMIRIDCQKSEANYIKEKILCSELSSIFDLSNIDWDLCNREALNSLVKQVCDLYKDGYRNIDIVNELQLDRHTVTKYLKIGSELGWCNYTPKQYKKVS